MNCFWCDNSLGKTDLLPELGLGRKIAFDPAHARVWGICRKCGRWSLANLDEAERRSVAEHLDRTYWATTTRTDDHGMGLAQLDRTTLIRVGDTTWRHFAAWRYGMRLAKRRTWFWITTAFMYLYTVWIWLRSAPLFENTWASNLVMLAVTWLIVWWFSLRHVVHVPSMGMKPLRGDKLALAEMEISNFDWRLMIDHADGTAVLTGDAAVDVIGRLMPAVYHKGANAKEVEEAVAFIERAGGPQRFFDARLTPAWIPLGRHKLLNLPPLLLNALEMAAHEESERRAIGSDLSVLRAQSTPALETAEISDRL